MAVEGAGGDGVKEAIRENEAEIKRRTDAINDGKALAFYEVCTNAFVNSAMELDKNLLTLAAGAIGFSLALITPIKESELLLFLYFLAIALFLATIFATLGAFKANTHHIEGIVTSGVAGNTGSLMKILDRISIWSFSMGVLLMTVVGACSVVEQRRSGKEMTDDSKNLVEIRKSVDRIENLAESLHMLQRLNAAPTPSPAQAPAQVQQNTAAPGTPGSAIPKMPGQQ